MECHWLEFAERQYPKASYLSGWDIIINKGRAKWRYKK
jgi:hypothetical protein